MNTADNLLIQLKQEMQKQNSALLHSLDTSEVEFDDNYYNNRYRIVQKYKLIYVKRRDPLSYKIVEALVTLSLLPIIVICPILPMLFVLAITIRDDELLRSAKIK